MRSIKLFYIISLFLLLTFFLPFLGKNVSASSCSGLISCKTYDVDSQSCSEVYGIYHIDCGCTLNMCGSAQCDGGQPCEVGDTCSDTETCTNDVPVTCPNGTCGAGETCSNCPGDCGKCPPGLYCGDNSCNNGEDCSTCPADCGACLPGLYCGDNICNNGEDCLTCPADCGDCPHCTSSKSHPDLPTDCNQTGFYGRTYAFLRDPDNPVSETYSCNPYAEAIGDVKTCTYWKNKWTGYLTVPQTGDYEFWVTYNPQLIFQMDVNGNGTFDTSCSNASQDPKAGDNYIFLSNSCNNKYRYTYLNSWSIINDALGGSCWDDFDNRIPCEYGLHCEAADLRTKDVSTYPTIINPVPKSERGSTECPISAVNSQFDNDWNRAKGTMDTFFKRSLTAGQVKLNIAYTSRVGDELNNQILQVRYRKVSTPAPAWVKLWKPESYPSGVCPITPCKMCMLTAPSFLNFTDKTPTSATINWTLPSGAL